ncbi:MAG: mRNA surveillance protein Pelota [Desulfurococcales archaeon]|nr:mRNA surveillance protein Pelota [Desulfurococcales archaeon]
MLVDVIDRRRERLKVKPESEEDLWVLKTVLRPGDYVTGRTFRDVARGGRGEKEKRPITVKLVVKQVEFQPFTGKLRVFGVIVEGPEEYGVKGKHQSILVTPGTELIIERRGGWPQKVLEKLKSAGPRGRAVVAAVDYDEYAIAVLSVHGIKLVIDTHTRLPGKEDPSREQELDRLINEIARRIVDTAATYNARIVVVAGPGTLKSLVADKVRVLSRNLHVMVDDVSMGGRSGIEEALRRPTIWSALREYTITEAEQLLAEVLKDASKGGERIAMGPKEVYLLAKMGAVERVVVVDSMIYSIDDEIRETITEALEEIENRGGHIVIVPEDSPIGERVRMMGGIIALLRFNVPAAARSLDAGD